MKSFLRQIEESFESLNEKEESMVNATEKVDCEKCKGDGCDHCDEKGYHEKVDEMSTTAGVEGYNIPAAFSKRTNPKLNQSTGYSDVPNKKLHTEYDRVQEAMDHKYERLIEGYKNFALNDSKKTPEQKVKESIKNVARQLKEIETTIGYTARLKTESGISHSGFKPATLKALSQISERLIKISERVRSLGE